MPEIEGVSHVALTVTDLARSKEWYQTLLGAQVLAEEKEDSHEFVVLLAPPLVIGLHVHAATPAGDRFDERRVGLDHVSFLCTGRDDLVEWEARLGELGIPHSPIADVYYGSVLVFRDPDNVQLELFALPGT